MAKPGVALYALGGQRRDSVSIVERLRSLCGAFDDLGWR